MNISFFQKVAATEIPIFVSVDDTLFRLLRFYYSYIINFLTAVTDIVFVETTVDIFFLPNRNSDTRVNNEVWLAVVILKHQVGMFKSCAFLFM